VVCAKAFLLVQSRPLPKMTLRQTLPNKNTQNTGLDYCNALLTGTADIQIKRLQSVQNTAERLMPGAQGRGSHSAGGANAPPTFGPVAPRWEHAPPTFRQYKGYTGHTVTQNGQVASVRYKNARHQKINKLEMVVVAMHCNLRPPDIAPVVLGLCTSLPSFSTIGQ